MIFSARSGLSSVGAGRALATFTWPGEAPVGHLTLQLVVDQLAESRLVRGSSLLL